jgi:microcystin degradation protein MlrC
MADRSGKYPANAAALIGEKRPPTVKIVIAMLKHETNTFSPIPTPLKSLGPDGGPLHAEAAYDYFKGTRIPMGAFIDLAEEIGAEIVIPIAARCAPSGPVAQDAFEYVTQVICDCVAQGCDALLLDLHGAMVTDEYKDGEGELLERIRKSAPGVPIGVGLDFHANMSERMVRNCDVAVGYNTYPHMDMYEAGRCAGELLLDMIAGKITPRMSFATSPILANILRMATGEAPMDSIMARAKALETGNILTVSVFPGFPLADTPHTRLSVLTVTDASEHDGTRACQEVLDLAWEQRAGFIYVNAPYKDGVTRAKSLEGGPVILLDMADNCNSGGTLDSMVLVREALEQGLENVLAGPIYDPEAVAELIAAGIGSMVTVPVGGKIDLQAIERPGEPLVLTGRVKRISDGRFVVRGPVFTGMQVDLGRTVVLDTGPMEIVVCEGRIEPLDLDMFRFVGIEPLDKTYIVLKSKIQYRPTFGAMAKHVVECNAIGVGSTDFSQFPYKALTRPIFPLDSETTYDAEG